MNMLTQSSWNASDFENVEVYIPDTSTLVGKTIAEVRQFIFDTYTSGYHVAAVSYGFWSSDYPEKAGVTFKEGIRYFFLGSNLDDDKGVKGIPFRSLKNSEWWNGTSALTDAWSQNDQAILLKKRG